MIEIPCLLAVPYGRLIGVLLALFLASVLYALLLQVLERRWGFVSDYTWLTVVVGVFYTLVGLAVLDWRAGLLALLSFLASAGPIVARSIINDVRERNELRRYLARRGNDTPADHDDRPETLA